MLTGMPPRVVLSRPLDEVEYDPGEFQSWLDRDAAWRAEHPHVVGGPLRDERGQMAPVPAYMRLDAFTDRDGPVPVHRPDLGQCWVWTQPTVRGYGYLRVGKRKVQAYRVNYERWVGPIPDGALINHVCRTRRCVRPDHLEVASYSRNARDSDKHPAVVNAAKEVCPQGHPYDEENTYRFTRPGTGATTRICRKCNVEAQRRRRGSEPKPRATATHCANGHPWEGNERRTKSGGRYCAACNRLAGQRFRERRRDATA